MRPAGVLERGKGNNVIAVDVEPATRSNLPKFSYKLWETPKRCLAYPVVKPGCCYKEFVSHTYFKLPTFENDIPRPLIAYTLVANNARELRMAEKILPHDMVRNTSWKGWADVYESGAAVLNTKLHNFFQNRLV